MSANADKKVKAYSALWCLHMSIHGLISKNANALVNVASRSIHGPISMNANVNLNANANVNALQ